MFLLNYWMDLQLPVQSVPITTNVVSSSAVHGEVYSIQHNVIKFVSDLTGRWFSLGTPVPSTNKTDHHDIAKILLKVAFNDLFLTSDLWPFFMEPGVHWTGI